MTSKVSTTSANSGHSVVSAHSVQSVPRWSKQESLLLRWDLANNKRWYNSIGFTFIVNRYIIDANAYMIDIYIYCYLYIHIYIYIHVDIGCFTAGYTVVCVICFFSKFICILLYSIILYRRISVSGVFQWTGRDVHLRIWEGRREGRRNQAPNRIGGLTPPGNAATAIGKSVDWKFYRWNWLSMLVCWLSRAGGSNGLEKSARRH